MPLTLAQAIDLALANNLDIAIEGTRVHMAAAQLMQALGVFDPSFAARYNYAEDNQPLDAESSVAAGGLARVRSETDSVTMSAGGIIPTGARYDASLRDTGAASTFNEFDAEHQAAAALTLAQPLLEGGGTKIAMAGVRIARRSLEISWLTFQEGLQRSILDVEYAYWDLLFAIEDLRVKRRSVRAAESLLEQARIRRDVQKASDAEVTQAESGLAQRQLDEIEARRLLEVLDRRLKNLTMADLVAARAMLRPIDQPPIDLTAPDAEAVLQQAWARRPELERAGKQVATAEDELTLARNRLLPQLDIEASYGFRGLADSFYSTVEDTSLGDNPFWSAGIVYTRPWPDRTSRGEIDTRRYQLEQELLLEQQERRRIVIEVGEVVDQLRSSAERIRTTELGVRYAQLALDNERSRYDVDKATLHDVLLLETELGQAESAYLRAVADHRKNQAQLEQARGTLLDRWQIELVQNQPLIQRGAMSAAP